MFLILVSIVFFEQATGWEVFLLPCCFQENQTLAGPSYLSCHQFIVLYLPCCTLSVCKKNILYCEMTRCFMVTGVSWLASCKALCSRGECSPVPCVEGVRVVLMRLLAQKRMYNLLASSFGIFILKFVGMRKSLWIYVVMMVICILRLQ